MEENLSIYLFISVILSYLLAYYIGRKREIGFWLSFTISVIATPIIGFVATIISKKLNNFKEITNQKIVFGWMFIIVYSIVIMSQVIIFIKEKESVTEFIKTIAISIFMLGLGFYLKKIGITQKEKNNSKFEYK